MMVQSDQTAPGMIDTGAPDLSLVVIARNEEALIEQCLESALRSLHSAVSGGQVANYEVIVVDSASMDRTATIARRYANRLIVLQSDWFCLQQRFLMREQRKRAVESLQSQTRMFSQTPDGCVASCRISAGGQMPS